MAHPRPSVSLPSPYAVEGCSGQRVGTFGARVARSKKFAFIGIGILAGGLVMLPAPVVAATSTGSMAVSASVTATCVVSSTNMGFGAYSGVALPSTATVTVTCTSSTPYTVALNAGVGTGPVATVTTRHMMGGAAVLNYGIYQDGTHATNWGNTAGTDTPASALGTGAGVAIIAYGLIPAGQYPAPNATYADTITVTVNF